MIYVISDLHGMALQDFQRLLRQAGFYWDDTLFVLGDTIDRGPDGIALLQWMMDRCNVIHLLGNHEAMLLSVAEALFSEISDATPDDKLMETLSIVGTMLENGAAPTLSALRSLSKTDPEQVEFLLDYLRDMPLYDVVEVHGTTYLLVHAGLGNFSPSRRLSSYTPEELLWHRPEPDERYDFPSPVKVIFGHTPTSYYGTPGQIFRTDTWCCIDTSDVTPTLLRLDDGKVFRLSEP